MSSTNFEKRFERIRQEAIKQNKSVNIDVRAYHGVWVAGVGGVQTCRSNSFVEVVQSIEGALNIQPVNSHYQQLVEEARQLEISVKEFGIDRSGHFVTLYLGKALDAQKFVDEDEISVIAKARAYLLTVYRGLCETRRVIEQFAEVTGQELKITDNGAGEYTAVLNGKRFVNTFPTVLAALGKEMNMTISLGT